MILGVGLLGFVATGCGSNTTEGTPDTGTGQTVYRLSPGPYCYAVTSILPGTVDGCDISVASVVGSDLPVNYDATTGILTVGTQGSLGAGAIAYNAGTLNRDGDTGDGAGCTWHQTDTTEVLVTAENAFTVSVTEVQSTFAAACGAPAATCTSTWSWTMQIDASKTVAGGCK